MLNAEDDKLYEIGHKFELSEEHRVLDEMNDGLELASYLREHVTNAALSGDRSNSSEFELVSHSGIVNSNEEQSEEECTMSDMFEESESGSASGLHISREGLRKQRKTTACTKGSSSYRQRKTDDQVKILTDLYQKHNGKLSRKVRKEAMTKTGLAWIQIYKWFFDR